MSDTSQQTDGLPQGGRIALAIALGAAAGALGWGIRGQFGGETGATVPGTLFGLCIALLLSTRRRGASALTLGAVGALAFSIGGSMTYGQTLGHMHNVPASPTYWWGFLGLLIKGGVWIGLGGLIVGMAASDVAYPTKRLLLLLVGAVALFLLGVWLLNSPHDPPDRLPRLYFSDSVDKPRREIWGGLLLGYLWLLGAAALGRDRSALRLSVFGLIGGAVGFSVGEVIQSWGIHAQPFGRDAQHWIDWWKVMECFFGATAGAMLAAATVTCRSAPTAEPSEPQRLGRVTPIAWLAAIWCLLYLATDVGLVPLDVALGLPFLGVAPPLLCCFHEGADRPDEGARRGRVSSFAVLVGLVLALSAANLVDKIGEQGLPGAPIAAGALVVTTVVTVWLVAKRGTRRPLTASWLLGFVAISQTVLTWLKSAIHGPDWPSGPRAFVSGAGLTVEIIFAVLAVAVVLLARAASSTPAPRPGPDPDA